MIKKHTTVNRGLLIKKHTTVNRGHTTVWTFDKKKHTTANRGLLKKKHTTVNRGLLIKKQTAKIVDF